ncbi:general stress protein [Spirosoma arcticum]
MDNQNAFVALFDSHDLAEEAVKKLHKAGYDMKKLSIVGQDYHTEENVVGYYNLGDRVKKWGGGGAFWGSIWGLLFGSAFFILPGLGPVVIAGPLIASLVGALEGAVVVGGLSALGAALYSLGIPKNSILQYETELKAGKFMLVAHGTADEVNKARDVLGISEETAPAVNA